MPKPLEVGASVSLGGKVQIREYRIDSSFYLSQNEKWSVDDLSAEEAEEFRLARLAALKEQLETLAQAEFNELFGQME
jgi:nicotinamide riboside kinase